MSKLVIELMTNENDSKEDIEYMIFDIADVLGDYGIPFNKIEFDGKIVAEGTQYHGLD